MLTSATIFIIFYLNNIMITKIIHDRKRARPTKRSHGRLSAGSSIFNLFKKKVNKFIYLSYFYKISMSFGSFDPS